MRVRRTMMADKAQPPRRGVATKKLSDLGGAPDRLLADSIQHHARADSPVATNLRVRGNGLHHNPRASYVAELDSNRPGFCQDDIKLKLCHSGVLIRHNPLGVLFLLFLEIIGQLIK